MIRAEKAENIVLRYAQQSSFLEEYERLKNGEKMLQSSKLYQLNAFLDDKTDLIRARGRLEHADIPEDSKTPIILPGNYRVTHLIIINIHREN